MNDNIINIPNLEVLPKPLSKEEQIALFKKLNNGDMSVREKLIISNIRLITKLIKKYKIELASYDKDDLFQIGMMGLIKAVDTYNLEKGVIFATYALHCIENEIFMFYRRVSDDNLVQSFNEPIKDKSNEEIDILEIIKGDSDVEEEYLNNIVRLENIKTIKQVIELLEPRDREIMKLYFGFYNMRPNHESIAKMLNISRSLVSKIIIKSLNMINECITCNKETGIYEIKETISDLSNIFEVFKDYPKYKVINAIDKLSYEDKYLLQKRYGNDLNNPIKKEFTNAEDKKFYDTVIYELKRIIESNKTKATIRTIYYILYDYIEEEIDEAIELLAIEDRELIYKRYGYNLKRPRHKKLTIEEQNQLYSIIIPKLETIIKNNRRKRSIKKSIYAPFPYYTKLQIDKTIKLLSEEENTFLETMYDSFGYLKNELVKEDKIYLERIMRKINLLLSYSNVIKKLFEKGGTILDDGQYSKIVSIIESPYFNEIKNNYNNRDLLILYLYLGYINKTSFSITSISDSININYERIYNIIKKILLEYKNKIEKIPIKSSTNL